MHSPAPATSASRGFDTETYTQPLQVGQEDFPRIRHEDTRGGIREPGHEPNETPLLYCDNHA
jgi:hypothetical protein